MNHWVIAPVIWPMLVAVAVLLTRHQGLQRWITAAGSALGTALVVWLVNRSRFEGMETYLPGNTLPPLGAVLVLDKLATLALAMVTLLHLAALVQAMARGTDRQYPMGLALRHLLLAGLSGAVLAGDLASLGLFWGLALVSFSGLVPDFRRLVLPGGAALAVLLLVAGMQAGSANLADLAERAAGGTDLSLAIPSLAIPSLAFLALAFLALAGLALAGLALWAVGFAAMLQGPSGAAVGLSAVVVAARLMLLTPMAHWLLPAAVGVALTVAAVAWHRGGVKAASLATATCGALALYLLTQPDVGATEAGLWLLLVAGLWSSGAMLASLPLLVPMYRRRAAGVALGLVLAALIAGAMLLPGNIPTRFANQITAIARQLHQPELYITAVIGLPDRPMLVPEPGL